jgi:Lrp/AsnC family transcriptional regulator, regulator for asnA, asnC and gidA
MEAGTDVPKHEIDADDRKILDALIRDARQSHRALAQKTGLALATLNRRVRRMEQRGVIRGYRVLLEPEAVGWTMSAIIGLRIEKGYIRQVQKTIAKDPRVFAVYDVTGEWDGVVLARLRHRADLDDLAKTTLSAPHIDRTNTMFVLATVAEEAVVHLPPLSSKPATRPEP